LALGKLLVANAATHRSLHDVPPSFLPQILRVPASRPPAAGMQFFFFLVLTATNSSFGGLHLVTRELHRPATGQPILELHI
jgi:hypothetical protein